MTGEAVQCVSHAARYELTFNTADFVRFEVEAIHPATVLSQCGSCRQIDRLNVSIVGPRIGSMNYARVSTSDHGPTLQRDALKAASRARMVADNGMFAPEAL